MGLLDSLFQSDTYGGQGGGLLDFLRTSQMQNSNYQPSPGFPLDQPSPLDTAQWPAGPVGGPSMPASFADRFGAAPGAPSAFAPSGRSFEAAQFDPSTYAPNQAQPIAVGNNYQMPRMGSADQFIPPPSAMAAIPQNAQPTQGQFPPQMAQTPQQSEQPLPPAFGGGGYLDRLNAGGGLIGSLLGDTPQQQTLKAQYHAIRGALEANGESKQVAASKAMIAVMNPEAAKTIIPELFTTKAKLVMRKDAFGAEVPYWSNDRDQTLTPAEPGGSAVGGGGYLAKGVTSYDPELPGHDYLKQFSPDVQSAIMAYKRGDSMPTGNARKGWAENVQKFAKAYGDKIGEPVSDQTFFEKKKLKTDLGSSSNSSMGGILDNGESSFAHLAELGKSFSELGSISHNFPGGGYLAQGQNAIGSAFGGSDTKGKIVAAKQNLTKYGQESTKFYAGTGGGVEERMAALKTVPPESSSGEEQAAYMEKEKQLMLDRLQNKFDHIKQTLGEEEGNKVIAKKLPTINQNIAAIDASIKKLRGEKDASSSKPATVVQNGHTYTLQSDGSYK